jgi:hypothetical protein
MPQPQLDPVAQADKDNEKYFGSEEVENYSNIITIDNNQVLGLTPEDAEFYNNFSVEKRKNVLRKVWTTLVLHYKEVIHFGN